jgi:hypothetical protein
MADSDNDQWGWALVIIVLLLYIVAVYFLEFHGKSSTELEVMDPSPPLVYPYNNNFSFI